MLDKKDDDTQSKDKVDQKTKKSEASKHNHPLRSLRNKGRLLRKSTFKQANKQEKRKLGLSIWNQF